MVLISGISILYYGFVFFSNSEMKDEFARYRLAKFRKPVGYLQLLGAAGLFLGFLWQPIQLVAAAGLALLMLMGFIVRIKMKDGLLSSMPSFFFMLLNSYICYWLLK
jgi:hypothetical protein